MLGLSIMPLPPLATTWIAVQSQPQATTALVVEAAPRPVARWERAIDRVAIAGTRPRAVRGLAIATLAAVAVTLLGWPWIPAALLAAGATHYTVATAREARRLAAEERARGPLAWPLTPEVAPTEIASMDLRVEYEAILRRHEEIRVQLVDAEKLAPCFADVLTRCGAMVQLAGRMARVANPLERHLRARPVARVRRELDDTAARLAGTGDPTAGEILRREASTRGRELATVMEIEAMRDRIRARLGVVHATLAAVSASVVKLHVLELGEAALPQHPEAIGELTDELDAVASTLEDGLAVLVDDADVRA